MDSGFFVHVSQQVEFTGSLTEDVLICRGIPVM